MKNFALTTVVAAIALAMATEASANNAAAQTGNARLLSYALSSGGAEAQASSEVLDYRGGYGESSAGYMTQYTYKFTPVLRYDTNINDGSVSDSLSVDGYRFNIEDDKVARAGVLAGVSFNGTANITLAQDLALQVSAGGYRAIAIGEDIKKGFATTKACVSYRFSAASYIDGCGGASITEGASSVSKRNGFDVSFLHYASFAGGVHEMRATVGTVNQLGEGLDYEQAYVAGSMQSAFNDGSIWAVSARFGEAVDGLMTQTSFISLSNTREIFGSATTFSLSHSVNEGGNFLGEVRYEETTSLSVTRRLSDSISVTASYAKTDAAQDFFKTEKLSGGASFNF